MIDVTIHKIKVVIEETYFEIDAMRKKQMSHIYCLDGIERDSRGRSFLY